MDMLDRLYRLFDKLTGKYSLFKVETIGDAYMTVGNLRTPQQDHAALVARFAMEAVQAANSVMIRSDDSTSGFLSIRAGVCTLAPDRPPPAPSPYPTPNKQLLWCRCQYVQHVYMPCDGACGE